MKNVMDGWGLPFNFGRKGAAEFVPTWQVGLEAESGQDIANLMDSGYSKNSLIFACIEEIATSFAELPPQVLLPGDDGMEAVDQHELLDLLESPNETMDAYEFKATMAVHHRTAGNVYIEKVRQSESLDRNRSFGKVKELGLIRPDYVSIEPGQRRAAGRSTQCPPLSSDERPKTPLAPNARKTEQPFSPPRRWRPTVRAHMLLRWA